MKEWVISLTAVLADGTVVTTHRRPRKSAAGYDLTHLVIGSEGTLALVTEATLKLAVLERLGTFHRPATVAADPPSAMTSRAVSARPYARTGSRQRPTAGTPG